MFPKQGLETTIVNILKQKSLTTKELLLNVSSLFKSITIQGIYKAIRELKKTGIVIIQKKQVSLNRFWLEELERFTQVTKNNLSLGKSFNEVLAMQDGDSILYNFKDAVTVDKFWNHILYILFDNKISYKWFAYASHHWFILAREYDEKTLQEYMNKKGIYYIFTSGSNTPIDKEVRKKLNNKLIKYTTLEKPLFQKRKNYRGIVLNVFGDYIIEAQYNRNLTNKIEEFYRTHTKITSEDISVLQKILDHKGKIKLKIEKNKNKALLLQKQLLKNFVL